MDRFLGVTVFIVIFLFVVAGLFFYGFDNFGLKEKNINLGPAEIYSFGVERPFLVITGSNLDSVKIFVDQTESDGDDLTEWGEAVYDEYEFRWLYEIPEKPELVYRLIARGYKEGNVVSEITLLTQGATELYNLLWSRGESLLLPLKVGQTGTFGDLSVRLDRILEDTRCLSETFCPSPGDVIKEISLKTVGTEERALLSLSGEPHRFENFVIEVIDVSALDPVSEQGVLLDYVVTFSLTTEI